MKLSHLYEAVDPRKLLKSVANELGFQDPKFYDIDDETSNAADVNAGLDLFRLHLDTEGSAQVKERIQQIERLALEVGPNPRGQNAQGMEALEYFEGTSFDDLPHVKAFHAAQKQVLALAPKVHESAKTVFTTYFLMSAINSAAITTMSSKFNADEIKYRSSIARACMKQLGMTPKDL